MDDLAKKKEGKNYRENENQAVKRLKGFDWKPGKFINLRNPTT